MSEAGYVRLHRSLLGHPAFRNDGEAMAFAWMIARASWKPSRVRYKGQAINLQRGQLAISIRDLAEALDRPKGWVERLFARLKSETMVQTLAETGVTIVTICNYAEYQADQDSGGTPDGTRDRTDAGQRQDTEQGREKGKKEEISSDAIASSDAPAPKPEAISDAAKRIRNAPMPANFEPHLSPEARSIVDGWPPGLFETELAQWRDHHASKGTLAKDWQASLRTWLRNAEKFRTQRNGSQQHQNYRASAGRVDGFSAALREVSDRRS